MPIRILYLESDPGIRPIFVEYLEAQGYAVTVAMTTDQASSILDTERIDLSILTHSKNDQSCDVRDLALAIRLGGMHPVIVVVNGTEDLFSEIPFIIPKPLVDLQLNKIIKEALGVTV